MNPTVSAFTPRPTPRDGEIHDPLSGAAYRFTITDEITLPAKGLETTKTLCLQRLEFEDKRIELRLAYWIIGKRRRMLGQWVWGQYNAHMHVDDFAELVRQAQAKGWI